MTMGQQKSTVVVYMCTQNVFVYTIKRCFLNTNRKDGIHLCPLGGRAISIISFPHAELAGVFQDCILEKHILYLSAPGIRYIVNWHSVFFLQFLKYWILKVLNFKSIEFLRYYIFELIFFIFVNLACIIYIVLENMFHRMLEANCSSAFSRVWVFRVIAQHKAKAAW